MQIDKGGHKHRESSPGQGIIIAIYNMGGAISPGGPPGSLVLGNKSGNKAVLDNYRSGHIRGFIHDTNIEDYGFHRKSPAAFSA
jgi:hypothetical protein